VDSLCARFESRRIGQTISTGDGGGNLRLGERRIPPMPALWRPASANEEADEGGSTNASGERVAGRAAIAVLVEILAAQRKQRKISGGPFDFQDRKPRRLSPRIGADRDRGTRSPARGRGGGAVGP
jgi:hypothetical protein